MSNKTYIAKLVNFVIYSCDYNALIKHDDKCFKYNIN